jgi:23S rRNA pseudouridine2605 synthase
MQERLQKIISDYGLASRRKAEELIVEGRITVNGVTAQLGEKADPDKDVIKLDNRPLENKAKRVYIILNKPRGYVCTLSDEKGRKTVIDLVGDCGARVYPVGRLDANSEGLLLLTNDGELTNALTHPSKGVEKTYSVRVEGSDILSSLSMMSGVMQLEDGEIRAKQVKLIRDEGLRAVITVTVTEGRKHLVRNMCANAGLEVKRLIRVSEGGLTIKGLRTGKWRRLTEDEVKTLKAISL